MHVAAPRLCFAALGLLTGACALAGYDFGDYERAPSTTTAGGASAAGSANGIAITGAPFASAGGEASANAAGAAGAGPEPSTFCEPRGCFELGLACGPAYDGCGQPLDCGPCFWWFQECVENRCEVPAENPE